MTYVNTLFCSECHWQSCFSEIGRKGKDDVCSDKFLPYLIIMFWDNEHMGFCTLDGSRVWKGKDYFWKGWICISFGYRDLFKFCYDWSNKKIFRKRSLIVAKKVRCLWWFHNHWAFLIKYIDYWSFLLYNLNIIKEQ